MKPLAPTASSTSPAPKAASVHVLGFVGDDAALHAALVQGHPGAPAALFDRYGRHVHRVLANVLGIDSELPDLLHEVFARALSNVEDLRDGNRLKPWLTAIAVYTARGCIRSRVRRRWLRFLSPHDMPEASQPEAPHEVREALRATYTVLERLPADLRVPFALRFIQGMTLVEVAEACEVSLATCKRRLSRAEKRFVHHARRHPALHGWIAQGSRWSNR